MTWPGVQKFAPAGRCDGMPAAAQPKPEAKRNQYLLAMARNQACLLKVPSVCNRDWSTTVAAHSNLLCHGKAKGRKADDQYHVHACAACHAWLDQGPAPAAEKESAFMRAHRWMVEIWRGIVAGFDPATPKEKAAALWALEQLNATPTVGITE
ncbi:MAG: DUF1364 family protein [Haliea sp.]|nr:MAG: DUF1364 family protein [Haliea sp.]